MEAGSNVAKAVKQKSGKFNVALLWQGQLVSSIGDAVYRIALGFWILEATGSTAMMGALLAASMIPRIVLSPFAGGIADRASRKWILVFSDLLCGLTVLGIGIAALFECLQIWMVFVAGLALGSGQAFFVPAMESSLPDVVAKERLIRINALFSVAYTAAAVMGNVLGGFLFVSVGAPLLFLINGVSFLFSACTELFVFIPKHATTPSQLRCRFWDDFSDGFALIRTTTGLPSLLTVASATNFLSAGVFVLLLAMFERNDNLGAGAYGVIMGCMSVGAFAGYLLTAVTDVLCHKRFIIFWGTGAVYGMTLAILPFSLNPFLMGPLMALVGAGISVNNTLLTTALQLSVKSEMRGKLLGWRATLIMSLSPLGMAAAGVLGEFVEAQILITTLSIAIFVVFVCLSFSASAGKLFSN